MFSFKAKITSSVLIAFFAVLMSTSLVSAVDGTFSVSPSSCEAPCTVTVSWDITGSSGSGVKILRDTTPPWESYGSSIGSFTVSYTSAGTHIFQLSADGINQDTTSLDKPEWRQSTTITAPAASTQNNTNSNTNSSSNNNSSSSNNNSSSSNSTSASPTPSPSPSPRPSVRPSPTPNLFPSPDATAGAVLAAETQNFPTPSPEVLGASTENNGAINPLWIVIPTVLLGIGLMAYFFKDRLTTSMQAQMATRRRARLMKMIASKQEIPSETPFN